MSLIYRKYGKRFLDVVLASLALVVLSPVLLFVAVLVRVKLGSPVLFKQQRVGKDEQLFTMYKFRSMTDERDENGTLLPEEARIRKVGQTIRAFSLDELPGLLNIIRGQMSIVGPRPLLTVYLPYYSETERRRHDVKPGLTGLAQVNGRNNLTWEEKFALDNAYIRDMRFWLDCKIMAQTAVKVVRCADVRLESEATEGLNVIREAERKQQQERERNGARLKPEQEPNGMWPEQEQERNGAWLESEQEPHDARPEQEVRKK